MPVKASDIPVTCKLPIVTEEGGGKSEEEAEVQASMPMFLAV